MKRSRLALLLIAALSLGGIAQAAPAQAAPAPGWRLIGATGPTNLPPLNSEVQRLLVNAEGGTFALEFEGQSTSAIGFDASPAELRGALEALPAIGPGDVETSGGPGDASADFPYFVRFTGALSTTDVPTLAADFSQLSGAAHTASVTTKAQGGTPGEATLAVYVTNVGGAASSGPIKVAVGPLPSGITAATASGSNGTGWTCEPATGGSRVVECESTYSVPSGGNAPTMILPLRVGAGAPASSTLDLAVHGGGAPGPSQGLYEYKEPLTISTRPAPPGVEAFWAGAFDESAAPSTQAGGHAALAGSGFLLNTKIAANGSVTLSGDPRNVTVQLPPGFLGNPLVATRCPQSALVPPRGRDLCFEDSVVGFAAPVTLHFGAEPTDEDAIYDDEPPFGYPAEFTFPYITAAVSTLAAVRTDGDYGITLEAQNIPLTQATYGAFFTLLGSPEATAGKALLTNPTDCAEEARSAPTATISANAWQDQDPSFVDNEITVTLPPVTNCAALADHFNPTFTFRPSGGQAASPSPFTAHLTIPQAGLTDPGALVAPQLKKAVITLPKGVEVNPSSANGLAACSEAQMGLLTTKGELPNPIRFDKSEPSCPDASKLGTVEAKSPLLEEALQGTIYLAAQEENPFHSLLALYLVIDSPRNGIIVKLPGEVKPDPSTGQLTATFDDNPQLPVEDLTLNFRGGGPRSPLATPAVCGTYTAHGELTPWSAPESGPPAQTTDSFQVPSGPGGGACPTSEGDRPFAPSFEAGTMSTAAGAYSPLVIKLARKDGEQELTHLDFTLPPGLTGKLAGIPYCSEGAITAAKGKSGKAELASASCPAASELGTVDTSAGVGSEPIHVGGHVYLAGPYEGAPLSSVVITPAVAGPFDLGNVVVRAPLYVDPETAQITAKSDEIPHILKGIPLQLRSVEIKVDRQGFALNPTSCEPMTVTSSMSGLNGGSAKPSSRFQVGGCRSLRFKPRLKLRLKGATKRVGHPALKAVLTTRPGEANIGRAQVNLPHGEFLDQGNLNRTCTKPVLLAGNCPKSTIYGRARAWTPLLDHPLEGYVFLVGGYGYKLPALVAELNGQIKVLLVGKVDSGKNKGIRNTFEVVPDAPVSRFVLEMKGGKKYGLLENSENLCKAKKAKRRAIARFTGQNGKVRQFKPVVANQCRKHSRLKHKKHHRRVKDNTSKNHKKRR